jgi:hypothetical protein
MIQVGGEVIVLCVQKNWVSRNFFERLRTTLLYGSRESSSWRS